VGSPDWLGLAGSAVVVAGAGGLGSTCAIGFVRAGARVLVVDRDSQRLDQLAADQEFRHGGGQIAVYDLCHADSGAAVVDHALATLGGLDVALHCLGINDRRPMLDFTDDEWERVIETNLGTAFRFARAAGRHMTDKGAGRVIFFSSVSGLLAHKDHGPYAASKGGINQMMRVMAAEWAATGVTVNAVAPGYIETALTSEHLERSGVRDALTSLVPAERLGVPEDVVGPVLFLASAQASFITGHVLYVDGGRTLV
jgi:gluconate 5-dehydrogenase